VAAIVCNSVGVRVVDEDGTRLDAEFHVEGDGDRLALIMESRSGASGSRPPPNRALSVLLIRLAALTSIGTTQSKVGQPPGASKGGNATKRIRLRLDLPGYSVVDAARLADALSTPVAGLYQSPARSPRPAADRRPRRPGAR
jgi:hypothetical protein